MRPRVFVPSRGQYDNIGDIILRRQLLVWLRDVGALHTYVGHAPPGYAEGLELDPADVRYASFRGWYLAALRSALAGRAVYAFKPGEIQLTVVGMKEHLSVLPLLLLCRLRGGAVVRVGSGSRNFAPLPRLLMWPSVRASDLVAWRDADTAAYVGRGEVMPDLAFGEGSDETVLRGGDRDTLVVSLRSDRPLPDDPWFEALRAHAAGRGLRIVVVSQVTRDIERSAQIARRLDGEEMPWDGTAPDRHEAALRAVYRRSALVVSDRLHVLIAALTEGAAISAAVRNGSAKIERHLAVIGLTGVSVDVHDLPTSRVVDEFARAESRRTEAIDRLLEGRHALGLVRDRVRAIVGGTVDAPQPVR